MFSKDIVSSDAFLEMSPTAQALYFHLGMEADDDGFVGNPKKVQRMVGSAEDDLKVLIAKRFILPFVSGVVVLKHWRIHNTIRKDRYVATSYREEKDSLNIKENKSYTDNISIGSPLGNHMATKRQPVGSIGEERRGEESKDFPKTKEEMAKIINKYKK